MYTDVNTLWALTNLVNFLEIENDETPPYNELLKHLYLARNFSKNLCDYAKNYAGYTPLADDAKNQKALAKFLKQKINACYGTLEEKDIPAAFAKPKDAIVKKWLTLQGDKNSKHYLDHSDKGRDQIFLLCFALGLDYEQSKTFFKKVYLDIFFIRRAKDVIFHYCLKNKLSYADAIAFWNEMEQMPDSAGCNDTNTSALRDGTFTKEGMLAIAKDLQRFSEAEKKANFAERIWNLHKAILDELMRDAAAKKEADLEQLGAVDIRGGDECLYDVIFDTVFSTSSEKDKCDDLKKSDFALSNPAVQAALAKDGALTYSRIYLHHALPTRDNFRESTLKKGETSFYTMRNLYILLKFYLYWFKKGLDNYKYTLGDGEVFTEELNGLLQDYGLAELYPCDPHDMIFLLATEAALDDQNPIYIYQEILSSVFHSFRREEDDA